jgi:hypothetical protein
MTGIILLLNKKSDKPKMRVFTDETQVSNSSYKHHGKNVSLSTLFSQSLKEYNLSSTVFVIASASEAIQLALRLTFCTGLLRWRSQ